MTDFLLELRSEEIPARMQEKAREDLRWLYETEMRVEGGLHQGEVTTYATPRRLVLIARGLADSTEAEVEEHKGPKVGAPDAAIEGFLKKTGATRAELFERPDAKGVNTYFVQRQKASRPTQDVLAAILPRIIRAFPWPKSMRWGADSLSTESLRWVRPLQGIIALFGSEVVPCEIAGVASGAATVGHRFHHPGVITIGSADDYVEKLRACHVIVDGAERRNIIALGAKMAAQKAGLSLIEDEGLLFENAGLTEWPMPLLGRFDEAFLAVPPEVIQLTARVNQKYFVCRDGAGKLANAFVCVANIDAVDGGEKIVAGNQKVLAARLSDARFFYETDLKVPLEAQAGKLEKIVFHEKLGTVADKVERVAKLARWLVESGVIQSSPERGGGPSAPADGGGGLPQAAPSAEAPLHHQPAAGGPPPRAGEDLASLAERAARLAKADLVTGMVGEFPELQGLMGGYYAAAQGEDPAVAAAIRDHYKPVGQGDDVPTDPVTVAVALADKLDTIISFFCIEERPSGSKDPFALRRAAIAVSALVLTNGLRLRFRPAIISAMSPLLSKFVRDVIVALRIGESQLELINESFERFKDVDADGHITEQIEKVVGLSRAHKPTEAADRLELFTKRSSPEKVAESILDFFADRLKVQQREAGVRHDLIDAVFALGGEDDLVRLLARVKALQAFVTTEDGANLLAGYKRAANILKKEEWEAGAVNPAPEPAEAALAAALDAAEPKASAAIDAEQFEDAMAALAILRAPIDAFFDSVTVNDADPVKRAARLGLLARMRDAVHKVADFGKIEG